MYDDIEAHGMDKKLYSEVSTYGRFTHALPYLLSNRIIEDVDFN